MEFAIQFPGWERHRLEPVGELRIGLNRPNRIDCSYTNQRNTQLIGEILQDVEKDALFADVTSDDMVDLVDDQHAETGGAQNIETWICRRAADSLARYGDPRASRMLA